MLPMTKNAAAWVGSACIPLTVETYMVAGEKKRAGVSKDYSYTDRHSNWVSGLYGML